MTFEAAKEKAIAKAKSGLPGATFGVTWDGGIVFAGRTKDGAILFWPDTPSKVFEPEVIEPAVKRQAKSDQTEHAKPKAVSLMWLAAFVVLLGLVLWEVVK